MLNQPIEKAADEIIFGELNAEAGNGGLIAVDRKGNIAMPFNSGGMHRGYLYKEKGKDTVTKAVGIGQEMKVLQE
jgi:beta-aspartyl-peptidase (threonine type)